jgi:hypothetical protein
MKRKDAEIEKFLKKTQEKPKSNRRRNRKSDPKCTLELVPEVITTEEKSEEGPIGEI